MDNITTESARTGTMSPTNTTDESPQISESLGQKLSLSAQADPKAIDEILKPHILSPDLPRELYSLIAVDISEVETLAPALMLDPSRPPDYYNKCLIHALLISRAYILLSPTPELASMSTMDLKDIKHFPITNVPMEIRILIYEAFLVRYRARKAFWQQAIVPILVRGLFSSQNPTPAARFITGIVLLTCGQALSRTLNLAGKGKGWRWTTLSLSESHARWTWTDVCSALNHTMYLPNDCMDWMQCLSRVYEGLEGWVIDEEKGLLFDLERRNGYVSQEVLNVLDMARDRIGKNSEDMSTGDILTAFFVSETLE